MYVADHNSAVRRNFKSRAMPEKEIPPARLVDIYWGVEHDTHLVQKTVPQVFTAKCSEPQAVIREDMSERSG